MFHTILAQDLGYVFGHSSIAEKPHLKEIDPLANRRLHSLH